MAFSKANESTAAQRGGAIDYKASEENGRGAGIKAPYRAD
jgi:hypothetical protein